MPGFFQDQAPLGETADSVPLTAIEPGRPPRGGIILLQTRDVLSTPLLDMMEVLAAEGWIVCAPDLLHREGEASAVFGDDLFADFDASFEWLRNRGVFPDTIGVLGFNDAGTAALVVATNRPVGAAITVGARGIVEPVAEGAPTLVDAAPNIRVPWLGLYRGDDPETPTEQVSMLREAAGQASVASNVVSAHSDGFSDSQTRILDWFDSYLR